MPRPVVTVREATPEDLPDLLAMWQELRPLGLRLDRSAATATESGVLARLAQAQANPDVRVVVATIGDEVVGMAVLTHQPFAALFDTRAAHVNYLHVRPAHLRKGAGRALVAAAAGFAEEHGAEHVVTSVYSQLREANRFYARLGFGPMIVSRVAALPALRRKLAAETRLGALDDVLQRRRSLRRTRLRDALTPAPVVD